MLDQVTAAKWLAEAQADSRLIPMFTEVEAKYPEINVRISKGSEWSAAIKDGKPTLSMAETGRPMPSFGHELSHLRLYARGYRHILAGGNLDDMKRAILNDVLSALDNELQHHRMYPEFLAAGFDGKDFYAESDDRSYITIRKEIKALKPSTPTSAAFLTYLTTLAPGGRWPDGVREDLHTRFEKAVTPEVWGKLTKTKAIIETWAGTASLNPTTTIVEILEALGDLGGSMIGEDIATIMTLGTFVRGAPPA